MTTFVVGPGIAQAMTADGTHPASDEIYVHGNQQQAQWSVAMAENGTEYRWVRSTGRVHRYAPGSAAHLQIVSPRYGPAPLDLSIAIRGAFPQSEWVHAAEVAFCESRWNSRCLLDTVTTHGPCGTGYVLSSGQHAVTERSRGYFQINGCAHPEWDNDGLFDAVKNTQAAAQLFIHRGNWGDWYLSAGILGLRR